MRYDNETFVHRNFVFIKLGYLVYNVRIEFEFLAFTESYIQSFETSLVVQLRPDNVTIKIKIVQSKIMDILIFSK